MTRASMLKPLQRIPELPPFDELEFGEFDESQLLGDEHWDYVRMDPESEKDVRHVYGEHASLLTRSLAKRLIPGKLYRCLVGQAWWLLKTDEQRVERIDRLRFLFYNPVKGVRFKTCKEEGRDYTFWAYPYKGILGTGSGCDPVYLFVK